MPVTKQTYSVTATWDAAQLASIFRSAFIDAGLMSEWHAAYTVSTNIHRVLEITYATGKTYGKCYYWFTFRTDGVYLSLATGWNTSTNVPTGTQYLDFWNTSGANRQIMALSNTTNSDLLRYTSQANNTHSMFVIKQGTSSLLFFIANPAHQVAPWIDLDKTFFHHFMVVSTGGGQQYSMGFTFNSMLLLRRSYGAGTMLTGDTSSGTGAWTATASYGLVGRLSGGGFSNAPNSLGGGLTNTFALLLPNALSSNNPAYAANYNPVVTGIPYSFYMQNSQLPSDIGIIQTYANNTMAVGDTFVVTAGVEEWEILAFRNNSFANTSASVALAARVI